ncbi:MAG: hypothetical protein GC206_09390 [Alphaproteobacteria bacterium]|nr:hypothetical protein [Alphaproteobacteria bacterium]
MAIYDFSISGIRGPVNSDGLGWATISVQLELDDPDSYPEIEIDVPIQFDQSLSIAQLRTIAFDRAIKLLQQAQADMAAQGLKGCDGIAAEKMSDDGDIIISTNTAAA